MYDVPIQMRCGCVIMHLSYARCLLEDKRSHGPTKFDSYSESAINRLVKNLLDLTLLANLIDLLSITTNVKYPKNTLLPINKGEHMNLC